MEPRLVPERVRSDLVVRRSESSDRLAVLFERGVLADDEERDAQLHLLEDFEYARHEHAHVRRQRLPALVAVRFR
jgi:hypothetical protein